MSPEDYAATQHMLGALAIAVDELPLSEFLQAIEHAEAAGPILDPTLYRRASRNLEKIQRLAEAAHDFQRKVHELLAGEVVTLGDVSQPGETR